MRRSRGATALMFVVGLVTLGGCVVHRLPLDSGGAASVVSPVSTQSGALEGLLRFCEPPETDSQATAEGIQDCYRQRLIGVLQSQGATIGMLTLYQLAEASPRFANLCHVTAHRISELAYEFLGNISEAMLLCKEGCAYACQHAVIRSYLRDLPKGTLPDVRQLCPHYSTEEYSMSHWQCTHGVGHGLAHYQPDIHQALATCKRFPLAWERKRCIQGVFMEFTINVARASSSGQPPAGYLSACWAVESDERFDCYNFLIGLVGLNSGDSVPAMFAACKELPASHRPGCFFGIGRGLTSSYVENEDGLIRVCNLGASEFATDCVVGFASVLVNFTSLSRGFNFCGKLSHDARVRCTEKMGIAVRLRSPDRDRIAVECEKAGEPVYVRLCREFTTTHEESRAESP